MDYYRSRFGMPSSAAVHANIQPEFRASDVEILQPFRSHSFSRWAHSTGKYHWCTDIQTSHFTASYQAPSLQLTDFRIDNIDARVSASMRPELMQMLADSTITLSYRHNSFTMEFESVSFRYQEDIAYEYMLQGFDRDWNKLGNNEHLRYTNVSPGKYQFRIQSYSLNSGLILSSRTTCITICQPCGTLGGMVIIHHDTMLYNRSSYKK